MSIPARLLAAFFLAAAFAAFCRIARHGLSAGQRAVRRGGAAAQDRLINLQLCFPEWTEAQRRATLREHFRLMATVATCYGVLWFGSKARVERLVRREGYEHYLAVQDRSIILLAPHFIGLDYGGIRHTIDHWGASMYSASHQNPFDELLLMGRSRFGEPLLIKRNDGIRAIVRALRQNVIPFYYLPDQDMGPRESIFAPFFGIPAATIPALSRLSSMGRAIVVPMITRLEKRRLCYALLPGVARLSVRRRASRYQPHEPVYRRPRARNPGAILLATPPLQNPARRRTSTVLSHYPIGWV